MKRFVLSAILTSLSASFALADAVLLKSGERYIGDVTEDGDSYRVKNATFPDGILVKRADVKAVYPKPEVMLADLTRVVDAAAAKYETAKKAADPNALAKEAVDMLFDPELAADEAAEIYPAQRAEFTALVRRMHELRKLCRDVQSLTPAAGSEAGKAAPKANDPVKPEPGVKDPPAKRAPVAEASTALDTVKSGPPSALVAALATFADGKDERACPVIIERLKTETDAQARAALKDALGKYAGYVIIRTIENTLKQKGLTEEFRRDVADILAPRREEKAVSILADLAFAADMRETRDHARAALAETGNASLKPVNRYIHHPDARTRVDAVEFVARIGTPEAYGVLAQCLILGTSQELMKASSIDVPLRDLATEKLIAGAPASCPALVAALSDGRLRKWASFCLQKISGEGYAESDLKSWTAWWRKRQQELNGK